MAEESKIVPHLEILQKKSKDCHEIMKKRNHQLTCKPRGKSKGIVDEMWGWLNSGQNQKDQQICSKSDNAMLTKIVREDSETNIMFDRFKRRKKMNQTSPQEIALLVEKVMALMEVAAEEDAELNRQEKPAIRKIQMLPLLTDFLSKKKLQQEFLDHGVLSLFKDWLEPLPDGSLPNATIRASILNILTQVLPVDIEQEDRREQLKKSGLAKAIMFLSKSDEEITANRKLAKDLIENWSRTIFNKSARYTDLRNIEENVVALMKQSVKKPVKQLKMEFKESDLDLEPKRSHHDQAPSSCSRQRSSRPEAKPSVYLVRPQSNFNPDIVKAHRRQEVRGEHRATIEKSLKRLKASNKKPGIFTCI